MKTAMKKLFSLVLVAVLLVGAMPFQAFADETTDTPELTGLFPCGKCLLTTGHDVYDHNSWDHCDDCDNYPCTCEEEEEPEPPVVIPATKAVLKQGSQETSMAEERDAGWSASVEAILVNWFGGDPAKFSNAYIYRFEGEEGAVGLSDTVHAGDEIHIRLNEDVPPAPETCDICGAAKSDCPVTCPGNENYVPCDKCWVDPCICCDKCNGTTIEHDRNCPLNEREDTKGQVKVYLNLNYDGAYKRNERPDYVMADRNALLKDVVASIPAPNRDKHNFQYWTTDKAGTQVIDANCEARATADGVEIYAQWADNILSPDGKYTIYVNLNYDRKMGEPVENIVRGTKMGDVLEYVTEPTRWNHKFVGWYWDRDCEDPVEIGDRVHKNDEIFAKWERRRTNNEVMLKIYLNSNTKSVAKIVDLYDYSKDGEISLSEVKDVVSKYYTAKDSDGLSFDGLFDTGSWSAYVGNHRHNGSRYIGVDRDEDTTVYVMVHNAKVRTSSSSGTADSTNPKTGDMIMNAVVVLAASASCLAALFYLNKKRTVK